MSPLCLLRRLCSAYDALGSDSVVVDFQRLDRWYAAAERVVEGSFALAESDGLLRAVLCRCLTCYFYQMPSAQEDEWYAYLMSTADDWASSLSPSGHWEGLPLDEALERIEVLNRISYMLLDHTRDAAVRLAYAGYSPLVSTLAQAPVPVLECWYALCTAGNVLPLNRASALRTARRLYRLGRRKYGRAARELRQWDLLKQN